jgi:hypothetical protein
MLCPKNNVDFVKKAVFGAKSSSFRHTKTAVAAEVANILKCMFVLCHKGSNKNV